MMTRSSERLPDCFRLAIADIGIEFSWQGVRPSGEATQNFYERFLSDGPADVRLRMHSGELPQVKPDPLIFDATENRWRLFRVNGQYVFEFFDTLPPHPKVQVALLNHDFSDGDVYLRSGKERTARPWSLMRVMRPFGELLLVGLLSRGRGLLVHALGISDEGEGVLFIGHSGAGKTTLANLYKPCEGVRILSDERVVVTEKAGQFWLSGTPWPGGAFTVSPDTVPLRKIFFLEHGTRNELIEDRLSTLACLLFQQVFLPFWNPEALGFALEFTQRLLTAVPSYRLAFVNDDRVIDFLRTQDRQEAACQQ